MLPIGFFTCYFASKRGGAHANISDRTFYNFFHSFPVNKVKIEIEESIIGGLL
jgi:hypothetical protein